MPSLETMLDRFTKLGQTGIPGFGITTTTVAPGHIARHGIIGKEFRNIPNAKNTWMPACHGVNRFELIERFEQRPALKAVLDTFTSSVASAEMVAAMIANRNFSVVGSNMTTALCTFADGGGITMATAGGANTTDAAILAPSLSTNQSAWSAAKWNTLDSIEFETNLQVAAVTTAKVYAGWKLTNTHVAATDANQCYFVFDTADTLGVSTTNWVAVTSRATSVTAIDTGVAVAAATPYHLYITIDANRTPSFYVNGVLVAVGNGLPLAGSAAATTAAQLTTNIDLIPYIGSIQRTNSTAVTTTVRFLRAAKLFND